MRVFHPKHKSLGFSLLEVMLSLILIGLLISGFLTGYQVYVAEKQETKEDQTYDSARSAMNAFITERLGASLRARYPCPARLDRGPSDSQYGQERRNADGTCIASADGSNGIFDAGDVYIGAFPAKSLGLSADMMLDAHGNKLTYAITKSHTLDDALLANPDGLVVVQDESGLSSVNAPFALISHGKDGAGAYSIEGGVVLPCRDGSAADGENCDFDDAVFKESRVKLGNSATFYDDRLAFSLADEDDDEWWTPFDDDPGHLHNKNPGIICIGAGCDHSDSVVGDALLVDGNTRLLEDLFVVNTVSAGGDVMASGSVLADGDVWARNNVEADKDIRALETIVAGGIDPATLGTGDVGAARDVSAGRDIAAGRNISATQDISAGQNVNAANNVTAVSDIEAGRDLTASRNISARQDVTAERDLIAERNASVTGNLNVERNVVAKVAVKVGEAPPGGTLGVDGNVQIQNGALLVDSDGDGSWGSLYNHSSAEGLVLSAQVPGNNRFDIVIHESGKVGIGGITDPKVALDVNGAIRLGEESGSCTNAKEGAIRYNGVTKIPEMCDGSAWRALLVLRNNMVKTVKVTSTGSQATAECPAATIRIGCSGTRDEAMRDTHAEEDGGFIGARPVGSRGCKAAQDPAGSNVLAVWAFCLDPNADGGGDAGTAVGGGDGDEPTSTTIEDICLWGSNSETCNCGGCAGGSSGWLHMACWDQDRDNSGIARSSIETGGMVSSGHNRMNLCVKYR